MLGGLQAGCTQAKPVYERCANCEENSVVCAPCLSGSGGAAGSDPCPGGSGPRGRVQGHDVAAVRAVDVDQVEVVKQRVIEAVLQGRLPGAARSGDHGFQLRDDLRSAYAVNNQAGINDATSTAGLPQRAVSQPGVCNAGTKTQKMLRAAYVCHGD
jgi:hypothetical protein